MAKSDSNILGIIVVALVAFIALALVFEFWLAPTIFAQNKQAGENIVDNTIDAEKAVQDYREFRQLWYDITSMREQLENYRTQEEQFHNTWGDNPNNWTRVAQERHGRIHDRITGTQNQISSMVAEYNGMSADATTSLYQCHLPYEVNEKLFIADATGVKYKSGADKGEAPETPNESCKYSDVPSGELNSSS